MTDPQTPEEWVNELFFPEAVVPVNLGNGTTIFTPGLGWGASLAKNATIIKRIQAQAYAKGREDGLGEAAKLCESIRAQNNRLKFVLKAIVAIKQTEAS